MTNVVFLCHNKTIVDSLCAKHSTLFERLSGSKALPTVIGVTWDSEVADKMQATMHHGEYIDRIRLDGESSAVTSMDISKNAPLLKDIQYALRCWKPQPAADFLLQWGQSSGALISTLADVRGLLGIIRLFCQHIIADIKQTDPESILIEKFADIESSFSSLL